MVVCLNSANVIANGANTTFNTFLQNVTLYGGLLAIDNGLSVVYAAGGLSNSCVQGFFEAEANALKYTTFVSNPMLLYYNFIYNFGLLYTSIKDVIFFFFVTNKNQITDLYVLGVQVGSFFYNLLSS